MSLLLSDRPLGVTGRLHTPAGLTRVHSDRTSLNVPDELPVKALDWLNNKRMTECRGPWIIPDSCQQRILPEILSCLGLCDKHSWQRQSIEVKPFSISLSLSVSKFELNGVSFIWDLLFFVSTYRYFLLSWQKMIDHLVKDPNLKFKRHLCSYL